MLKSKEAITYNRKTLYQEPKAFTFTHSNICKIQKGQAPRGYNGERIELHPISGKDPGLLLEIRSGLHDKFTKQLHFLVTKSFRRDKTQAPAYDKFREGYRKNVSCIRVYNPIRLSEI